MSENNFNQFLSKKAYEISYALFRMAAVVRRPSFADHMESRGLSLLDAAVAENYEEALILVKGTEYLLRFGADVGILSRVNVEIVTRELDAFNSAIAEFEKSATVLPVAELGSIFSKLPPPIIKNENQSDVVRENKQIKPSFADSADIAVSREDLADNSSYGNHNVVKSAMRQSAILERIRQNGNCRLKEIQEFLPETSERTLRYDVQNLIEQGLIERIGNGGPATHYKVKEVKIVPGSGKVTFAQEGTL